MFATSMKMEILVRAGTVRSRLSLLREGGSWRVCLSVVASGSRLAFKLPELCAKDLRYPVRDGLLKAAELLCLLWKVEEFVRQ